MITKRDEHRNKRHEFALKLMNVIRNNLPLCYMDESSFHSGLYTNKTWAKPHRKVNVPINQRRMSKTAIATIGNCLKSGYVVTLASSTNRENVMEHMERVVEEIRDPNICPYLVLDNAAAHK